MTLIYILFWLIWGSIATGWRAKEMRTFNHKKLWTFLVKRLAKTDSRLPWRHASALNSTNELIYVQVESLKSFIYCCLYCIILWQVFYWLKGHTAHCKETFCYELISCFLLYLQGEICSVALIYANYVWIEYAKKSQIHEIVYISCNISALLGPCSSFRNHVFSSFHKIKLYMP